MRFSMRWIETALSLPVLSRRGEEAWDETDLTLWEVFGGDCGWEQGTLILLEGAELPEKLPAGAAALCAGGAAGVGGRVLCTSLPFPELLRRVQRFFRRFDTLEKRMAEAAMLRRSIPELTELMAAELHGEVCVVSANHKLLSDTLDGALLRASRLPENGADGYLPGELVSFLRSDESYLTLRASQGAQLYEKSILCCDVLAVNVFCQGNLVCRCLHSSLGAPLLPWEGALLEQLAGFVGMVFDLAGGDGQSTPQGRLQSALSQLLEGQNVAKETLAVAMQERGWRREGPFVCLCLLPSQGDLSIRLSASYYCRLVAGELAGVCVFEEGKYILCLAELSASGGTAQSFMERSVEFLRDNQFLAGISNEFDDLREIAPAWKQACAALEVGMEERPTFWYHRFSDLALRYLLRRATAELDGQHICAPQLLTLRRYDAENGTEYLNTLSAYLYHGCNAVQTARALFIHRGTMIYRLRRIGEITGLSTDTFADRLYLGLSCLLLSEAEEKEIL